MHVALPRCTDTVGKDCGRPINDDAAVTRAVSKPRYRLPGTYER